MPEILCNALTNNENVLMNFIKEIFFLNEATLCKVSKSAYNTFQLHIILIITLTHTQYVNNNWEKFLQIQIRKQIQSDLAKGT